jgi:hypothetical protein
MPRPRLPLALPLAAVAAVFASLVSVAPATASPCGNKVLKDWSGNSRIDGTYQLHCYQDAIDSLPIDLRDYSDAPDVIGRAFREAGGRTLTMHRTKQGRETDRVSSDPIPAGASPSAVPIPLLVLAGVALALLAAGGLGYISRRRRADD